MLMYTFFFNTARYYDNKAYFLSFKSIAPIASRRLDKIQDIDRGGVVFLKFGNTEVSYYNVYFLQLKMLMKLAQNSIFLTWV